MSNSRINKIVNSVRTDGVGYKTLNSLTKGVGLSGPTGLHVLKDSASITKDTIPENFAAESLVSTAGIAAGNINGNTNPENAIAIGVNSLLIV